MLRTKIRQWGLVIMATSFLAVSLAPLLSTAPAYAAPPAGKWTSGTQITWNGMTFNQITTSGTTMTLGGIDTVCGPWKMTVNNYQTATGASLSDPLATGSATTCGGSNILISLSNTFNSVTAPTTGGTGTSTPSCENNGFSLAWMFCPIIEGLAKAVDGIYGTLIQPELVVKPLDLSNSGNDPEHVYAIWSNFRIYGDVFLIIALLVIVFGQSIGGGMVDAYTAKKVLPRLIIAAIAINLSLYIVALAIDMTNVIGSGVQNLLEAPFKAPNGGWTFNLGGAGGQTGSGIGMAALVGGGIWAISLGSALWYFLFTFVLLPALFVLIAILATVIIRQALIIFLVFTAPVAFALYCLPNTEQYFHRWWKMLLETLMVYPIIAIIFALANILSVVVLDSSAGVNKSVAVFLSIFALIAPLVLIPYSFRLAGGALGKAHDVLTDYGKRGHQAILGNPNDPNSMRNRARYRMGDRNTQLRERAVKWGNAPGSSPTSMAKRRIGALANFGNLQGKRSMYNKQEGERVEGQIATGDDTNVRDMFIGYDDAAGKWYRRMDMQKDDDGNLRAMAGASKVYDDYATGANAHRKALSVHGKRNKSAFQSGLYYEWKKTSFSPHAMDNLGEQYSDILQEHGFNAAEGSEAMKAVGFRHQGQALATKYSSYKPTVGADGKETGKWGWTYDRVGMSKEIAQNLGTGEMTRQDVRSYDELAKGYSDVSELLTHQGSRQDHEAIPLQKGTRAYGRFNEYSGKTFGQLKDAQSRMREEANILNPSMTSGGTVRPPLPEGGDDHGAAGAGGIPQSGYGISYAPVDVQAAASRFHQTVQQVDAAASTGAPIPPPVPRPERHDRV